MVRCPDKGPQVASHATGILPSEAPNTAHSEASIKLSSKTAGPSIPSVILLAARLTVAIVFSIRYALCSTKVRT